MNTQLQKLFSVLFNPEQQARDISRGASTPEWTLKLRDELPTLFKQHGIRKMFDGGCNDCSWSRLFDKTAIDYLGGDISLAMIAHVWKTHPEINVILHDVTTDPIPDVDVLFVRDVTIHINNRDRRALLQNWLRSSVPWIMLTHDDHLVENIDFEYNTGFPFSAVNWQLPPWNFPKPTGQVYEIDYNESGRCMALWHRDQLRDLI